jgi:ABC-2 type transport system permease protein
MRYLRLYLCFLRFSLTKALQFRLDFWFRVAMDVVFYAVHLTFFAVLYGHIGELGGWTLDQAWVFICGMMVVDALMMTFFSNNLWWLPIFVNRGDLDYYLVRPVSSLFFLMLREFAANSFVNLLIAASLLAWALIRYPEPLGALTVTVYLLLLMVGAGIYALIRLVFLVPVFWIHTSRGLDELSWSVFRLAERPHQIYAGALRVATLTLLPVGLIASVPAHVVFAGPSWQALAHVGAVAGGLFAFAVWFWQRGLRAYSSASS